MSDGTKYQAIEKLRLLKRQPGKRFNEDSAGESAVNQDSGILIHEGVENYHGRTQALENLPVNLLKWPPLPRYLVAELERCRISRPRAVELVRSAWLNAGGTP